MNIKAKLLIFGALAVLSLASAKSVQAESFLEVSRPDQMAGRNVASPADNINFFGFSLTNAASSTEDITINRLVINNIGTSGEQARSTLSSLSLYSQAGELIARTSTRSGRNGYVFTNLNYNIPNDGRTYSFGIHATVNNSIREGLTIKLAVNNVNSLRAIGAETRARTQISGNFPVQGNEFTITADGDNGLGRIAADAENNPVSANVVAGSTEVPVLNVRFRAYDSAFRLNILRFSQLVEDTTRSVESLTIGYQNQAGNTVTATRNFSNNSDTVTFNLYNDPAYLPAGSQRVVNVYANLAVINQNFGAYTGDQLKFAFIANQGFSAKNENNRLIRSAVAENNQVEGNIMVVHGTVPTIEAVADNGDLANGPVDLYRFKVTAAEGGTDVSLKKLTFKMSLTDSVINSATLYLSNFQILEGPSYDNAENLNQSDWGVNSYQIYGAWSARQFSTTTIQTGNILHANKLSHATAKLYQNNAVFDGARGQGATSTHDIVMVFNDDRLIRAGESKYYILRAVAGNVDTGADSNDAVGTYMSVGEAGLYAPLYLESSCDQNYPGGRQSKYCLNGTDWMQDSGEFRFDTGATMIWSDTTGTDGNGQHSEGAHDSSKDWFNGWGVRTMDVQRILN
ncbi:MAG: hypothetical protein Q8O59_02995 [bacterium]|nr:hypothetical protein [bacterium]